MSMLTRKGLLAVAAVVDIALQKEGQPVAAKTLASRLGLPPRHLENILQSLMHRGILKGNRGPHGGYTIAREQSSVTANDILRAAEAVSGTEAEPKSDLFVNVVLPALEAAEKEFGQALDRISLDDIVRRAVNGGEA